jgi:hypothetical protein
MALLRVILLAKNILPLFAQELELVPKNAVERPRERGRYAFQIDVEIVVL